MSGDLVLASGHATRAYCSRTMLWLDSLLIESDKQIRLVHAAVATLTEKIDAAGDDDAVLAADWRAARNLLNKVAASLEHVRLDLRIARDATDGLDHRAAVLLALDLSDTLPWTEGAS